MEHAYAHHLRAGACAGCSLFQENTCSTAFQMPELHKNTNKTSYECITTWVGSRAPSSHSWGILCTG